MILNSKMKNSVIKVSEAYNTRDNLYRITIPCQECCQQINITFVKITYHTHYENNSNKTLFLRRFNGKKSNYRSFTSWKIKSF